MKSGSEKKGRNNLPKIQRRFGDWIHPYLSPRQSVGTRRKLNPFFLSSLETISKKKGGQYYLVVWGCGDWVEKNENRDVVLVEASYSNCPSSFIHVSVNIHSHFYIYRYIKSACIFLREFSRHAAKSHGNFKHRLFVTPATYPLYFSSPFSTACLFSSSVLCIPSTFQCISSLLLFFFSVLYSSYMNLLVINDLTPPISSPIFFYDRSVQVSQVSL